MGITEKSLKRLQPYLQKGKNMWQLGCQNIYTEHNNGGLAHDYFEGLGLSVLTIDITGCQGAKIADLREPLIYDPLFDIVTDFGTTEHCDGNYYQVCKNIHDGCKVGGVIIRENPKTCNWIGHGCNYLDLEFYQLLAEAQGYEIIELVEEAAMGNITDGWNISVVLKKLEDKPFISEKQFKAIGHVFSK